MNPGLERAVIAAHRHAEGLDQQVLGRWSHAWMAMDRMRSERPVPWPDWCLLPMAAAVAVTGSGFPPPPVAVVSALYAWRYSRGVWMVEPALLERLLGQVPDVVDLALVCSLPAWCVYVAGVHPEFPGAGLWMHLEHDVNTGRPELRLLLDPGGDTGLGALTPIPVYLNRGSLTEAVGDYRATAAATMRGVRGADVRGGELDEVVAALADRVDAYVGLAAYLARPEADIAAAGQPGVRPGRVARVVRERKTWLVGYGG